MKNRHWCCSAFLIGAVALLVASLLSGCGCPTPPPTLPTIAASPSSFSFTTEEATTPPSQTLRIQNSGEGTLDWSATDDGDWLTLSPTSGSCSSGETDDVTVSADATGLATGDYSATITISAPEATNTPQTVAVNLTISPAGVNMPPNAPSNPFPPDGATGVSTSVVLSWTGGDPNVGDTVTYDVYFGTSSEPPLVSDAQSDVTYSPGILSNNTQYYWKVIATDSQRESTSSPVWDFTTTTEAAGVTVSLDAPSTADADSDFTVTVDISQVTDFDAADYDVSFDDSVLRLDDVTAGEIDGTEIPIDSWDEVSPGTYTIVQNVPGVDGVTGSGTLAELHFHVIGTAGDSSDIDLSDGTLNDNQDVEIEAEWVGDSITVTEAPTGAVRVSLNAPTAADADSDFTATVDISQVTNFDAASYRITFDESVLRLDDVTAGEIDETEIPIDIWNEISPGTYTIVQNVPGLDGVTGSGTLAELHFHVIGTAGNRSYIGLQNGTLGDNAGAEIEAEWVGDMVTVSWR